MLKCANGHEMVKGSKFCGECGGKAADEAAQCGACSAEMVKSAKFCPECGTKTGAAEPQLDQVLEEMGAFAKARIEREKELELLPIIEEGDVDHSAVEKILAKAAVPNEQGNLDAGPIVEALLKSVNTALMQARTFAEHDNTWMQHLADGQGKLVKATIALVGAFKSEIAMLKSEIAALSNASRGRRTGQAVIETLPKREPAGGADNREEGKKDPRLQLRGPDLFAKAELGWRRDPEALSLVETGRLESYTTGMNQSLEEIAQTDPQLAERTLKCVILGEQSAH